MEPTHIIIVLGTAVGAMAAYIVRLHLKLDQARKDHIKFAERTKNLAANGSGGSRRDKDGKRTD